MSNVECSRLRWSRKRTAVRKDERERMDVRTVIVHLDPRLRGDDIVRGSDIVRGNDIEGRGCVIRVGSEGGGWVEEYGI